MFWLTFFLVFGIALLVISGLVFAAAWMHKDVSGDYTPVSELLDHDYERL